MPATMTVGHPSRHTVALVDDDEDLRHHLCTFLTVAGLDCWGAASAEDFYVALLNKGADLVLVDLGLPGENGLSLTRRLVEHGVPVVVVSGHGSTAQRIEALNAGALQFFVKPAIPDELLAGVRALLARLGRPATESVNLGWRVDAPSATLVSPEQVAVPLTSRELELIQCLLRTPNQLVSKKDLLRLGNAAHDGDYHRIEALLQRLRKKTLQLTGLALPVRSVFGKGLVFTQ